MIVKQVMYDETEFDIMMTKIIVDNTKKVCFGKGFGSLWFK
jgi:hypothetical protein